MAISAACRRYVDLPPMLGPVMMAIRSRGVVQVQIVGDEAAGLLVGEPLDHRMAARHDAHLAVVGKRRPLVAILGGHLRQRGGDIQLGDGGGGGANALRLRGGALADIGEQFLLQRQNLLFGIQHLALVVLQLGRGEALGVGQRLLAFVIGGRQVQIGAGDFDVVAEDVVEAHLERLDAGALALARFDLRDVLLAVLAQVAQLVELGVEAGANGAAVGQVQRRLVGDGVQNQPGDIGQLVEPVVQRPQARRLLRVEAALERGNLFERAAQRQQIARTGGAERHLGQQPLEIENAAQLLAQLRAQDGLLQQFADGVQALLDLGAVHGRPQQALAQQAAAHAGLGLVEHGQHVAGCPAASAAKIGSISSRLRTVTASSIMESARS